MSVLRTSVTVTEAAQHLINGHCVAMPTETVYGLAARFDSIAGIQSIFRLKERPLFDPLIVHISNFDQIKSLARHWPLEAESLARRFWPGPLTLVVDKADTVSSLITAGLETVGLRMPDHPMALELIDKAGAPLAAPSANRFGRTSPTSAAHVATEFPKAVASGEILILEGGPCHFGVESTVCRVTEGEVSILRPGAITEEDLQNHFQKKTRITKAFGAKASPGHTEHHYETTRPLIVAWTNSTSENDDTLITSALRLAQNQIEGHPVTANEVLRIDLPIEPVLAARELYGLLRQADREAQLNSVGERKNKALFIRRTLMTDRDRSGLWQAIDDRLKRAARLKLGVELLGETATDTQTSGG